MNEERMVMIRERLMRSLAPSQLEIEDESHLHAGHAGAEDGRGHFVVTISAAAFAGQSLNKKTSDGLSGAWRDDANRHSCTDDQSEWGAEMRPLLGLAVLVLVACGDQADRVAQSEPATGQVQNFEGEVVAEVYGQPIAEDLLLSYLQIRGLGNPTEEQRQQTLNSLIDLYLLEHEARNSGMLERRVFKARMEVQRLSWIANEILNEFATNNPITDAQVQQAYELEISNRSSLEYRLRHILLPQEQDIVAVIARLQAGESFASVETELAAQVGSSNAGALGWVNLAQVPAGFAAILPAMEAGQFSAVPIATEYGFHVLFLEEVRSFAAPDIDSLKDGIRQTLGRRRLEEHMTELRAAADLGAMNQGS